MRSECASVCECMNMCGGGVDATVNPADFETTTQRSGVSVSGAAHVLYRPRAGQGKHLVSFSSTNFTLVIKITATLLIKALNSHHFQMLIHMSGFKCAATLKSSIISRARAQISQGKSEYSEVKESFMGEPLQYRFYFTFLPLCLRACRAAELHHFSIRFLFNAL